MVVNGELKLLWKYKKAGGGGWGPGPVGSRGQGGCEPRIEHIVKMKKVGRGSSQGGGGEGAGSRW